MTAVIAVVVAALVSSPSDILEPRLSVIAGVPVYASSDFPDEIPGREESTIGGWWANHTIYLRPALVQRLGRPRQVAHMRWWRRGAAVLVFAHEIGHERRGSSEASADAWARRHFVWVARELGYSRRGALRLRRTVF